VETLRDRLLEDMAPQTVSDIMRVLSQALSRAEARGLVGRNVADPALEQRPAGEPKDMPIITPKQGQAILAAVIGKDPWDAAVHLALGVSLRREEVLALRWSDVGETVAVTRTITAAGGELHIGPPKSAAGERELPLPGSSPERCSVTARVRASGSSRSAIPDPSSSSIGAMESRGSLPASRRPGDGSLADTVGKGSPSTRSGMGQPLCSSPPAFRMRSRCRSWDTPTRES
jgi:hypothetical protein